METDDYFCAAIERTIKDASTKLKFLGSGRHRTTFALNDRFVLKVPHNEEGINDNESEGRASKGLYPAIDSGSIPVARCRIVCNSDGIPLLVMERVRYARSTANTALPSWTDYVDCAQVGHTRKGRLVAYDFAY